VDGRDKPGHDEKRINFNLLEKALEMLTAFSVRLWGAAPRRASRTSMRLDATMRI
jgi:hypothetical protein